MPRIELIDVPLHQPEDPYHFEFDNLPLKALKTRQELINSSLDNLIAQMRDAIGTQNTVANRLNQSIEADGSLKKTAIDGALHSIEEHEDNDNYVRMTTAERTKLEGIDSEATNITVTVGDFVLDSGTVIFGSSSSIEVDLTAPNTVKFDLAFDPAFAHQHYYGLEPVSANSSPDYINYKVTSVSTPFMEGSLRIYVNGVRIFEDQEVYVPGVLVDDPWTLLTYTPNHSSGTFALSAALTSDDIIKIDFDGSLIS